MLQMQKLKIPPKYPLQIDTKGVWWVDLGRSCTVMPEAQGR
jgi:hypothetical protein